MAHLFFVYVVKLLTVVCDVDALISLPKHMTPVGRHLSFDIPLICHPSNRDVYCSGDCRRCSQGSNESQGLPLLVGCCTEHWFMLSGRISSRHLQRSSSLEMVMAVVDL
jgi:hypothetical protein